MRKIQPILLTLALAVAPAVSFAAPVAAEHEERLVDHVPGGNGERCCECACAGDCRDEGEPPCEDESAGRNHSNGSPCGPEGCPCCPEGCPNACAAHTLSPAIVSATPAPAGQAVQWADPPEGDVLRDAAHRDRDIDPPRA